MMREVAALPLLAIRSAIFSRAGRQQQLQRHQKKAYYTLLEIHISCSKFEIRNSILDMAKHFLWYFFTPFWNTV